MFTKRMLRYGIVGGLFALTPLFVAPALAKPPGGTPPGQANKPNTPPGNPDCARDEGKASPKKANPNGNACGQTNNPPFN